MRDYIAERGYEVPIFGSFNEENDNIAARISAASIHRAITRVTGFADLDAVFISCTSLRLVENVVNIEKEIDIPVTSSNHAMAWHCLRLAGVDDRLPEFGRLYEE